MLKPRETRYFGSGLPDYAESQNAQKGVSDAFCLTTSLALPEKVGGFTQGYHKARNPLECANKVIV